MVVQIQLRRDTAANWTSADPTLAEGELGVETDTGLFKFGDGATAWTGLSYAAGTFVDPMTTRGDIIVEAAGPTPGRLAIGSAATVLKSDGTDPAWGSVLPANLDVSADNTTADATTGHHGLLPKLGGGTTNFLRADGTWAGPPGGLADQGTFTYLDAAEAAAPATPAAGKVRVYAKADGRLYSKDDGGVEYGPFDAAGGGGATLSDFRLSGVADDGTFSILDEMEYASPAALAAVWTPHGTTTAPTMRPAGSSAYISGQTTDGQAMDIDASAFDADFEVAFLVTGHLHYSGSGEAANHQMCGIHLLDASGNGLAMTPYSDGGSYLWNIVDWQYDTTNQLLAATANTAWQDGRPVWWAFRQADQGGGNSKYRLAYSADGSTWTAVGESTSITTVGSIAWCGWGRHLGASLAGFTEFVHAVAYGTANLGI